MPSTTGHAPTREPHLLSSAQGSSQYGLGTLCPSASPKDVLTLRHHKTFALELALFCPDHDSLSVHNCSVRNNYQALSGYRSLPAKECRWEESLLSARTLLLQKDASSWRVWLSIQVNTSEMLTPLMERRGLSGLSGSSGLSGLSSLSR